MSSGAFKKFSINKTNADIWGLKTIERFKLLTSLTAVSNLPCICTVHTDTCTWALGNKMESQVLQVGMKKKLYFKFNGCHLL